MDHYRRPKLAYETVKRAYSPLLISLDWPLKASQAGDKFCASVWVINDLFEQLWDCRWEVALTDESGKELHRQGQTVNIAASCAQEVGTFECLLPAATGWRLACCIKRSDRVVVANEYDLSVHDGLGPTFTQRLRARLGEVVLPH